MSATQLNGILGRLKAAANQPVSPLPLQQIAQRVVAAASRSRTATVRMTMTPLGARLTVWAPRREQEAIRAMARGQVRQARSAVVREARQRLAR